MTVLRNVLVRRILNGAGLEEQPVTLLAATRHFTADQAAPFDGRFLFHATEPINNTFMWYGVQTIYTEPDGRDSLDAFVAISWRNDNGKEERLPADHRGRIDLMKQRGQVFAEPLRSIIADIPDDLDNTVRIHVADYPCRLWKNRGIVTLAGDAAHAMTMYRGEGANHGILDAALIVDQLVELHTGRITQPEALRAYEEELFDRAPQAVLRSRQAALDAHSWVAISTDSPLVGPRIVPEVLKATQDK
jgi:2-polyprenyl-6-methoxyphenol hydroxylase-like FAD-dependent oxidoreductase